MEQQPVPIWEKENLTIPEAAILFNIGENKLRELTSDPRCSYVLFIGTRRIIKKRKFMEYLDKVYSL